MNTPFPSHSTATLIPKRYVVVITPHHCISCGSHHTVSQCFAEAEITTRLGMAKPVIHRRATHSFEWNVPVVVEQATITTTPTCEFCCDRINLSSLPTPIANASAPTGALGTTASPSKLELSDIL